jgi:threonine dehydrogenase-like Zn-dependent dehydrogenase
MGLLSIHLLKERGAEKCIGVDHDKKILESATLISEVYINK